jgi:hypothetical protein
VPSLSKWASTLQEPAERGETAVCKNIKYSKFNNKQPAQKCVKKRITLAKENKRYGVSYFQLQGNLVNATSTFI